MNRVEREALAEQEFQHMLNIIAAIVGAVSITVLIMLALLR